MRSKLHDKKIKRLNDKNKYELELSESKISEDTKSSSFMARKQSLFAEKNDFDFCRVRKMSVAD